MGGSNFILYLIRSKVENFIFFLGFICAMIAYTSWKPLGVILNMSEVESYQIFYVLISVAFFFYTFAFFLVKYKKWRWFPMFVYLVCLSRVIVEVTDIASALNQDLLEYGMFAATVFIVFGYYFKYKYEKYLKLKKGL